MQTKQSFTQMIKVFKMIYDFSLLDEKKSAVDSFIKATSELKINIGSLGQYETVSKFKHFFSDIFKLKEYPLYRYLFNFPLFGQFIQQFRDYFQLFEELNLQNYSDYFIQTVKTTQLIDQWIKKLTIQSMTNIIQFTYLNLLNGCVNNRFKNAIDSLHRLVIEPLFDLDTNKIFSDYYNLINEMSISTGLNLKEEILDLKSNEFLIQKIKNKDKLLKLSELVQMQIMFYLSKYRLEIFYSNQHDSLLSLTKNVTDNNAANVPSFKFIGQFADFYEIFIQDSLKAVAKLHNSELIAKIKSTVYLFEKFYLLIAVKFDSHLTMAYMKYYWNFLHESFIQINELCPK